MKKFLLTAPVVLVSIPTMLLVLACGQSSKSSNGGKTNSQQLGGDASGNCLKLGDASGGVSQIPVANTPSQTLDNSGGKGPVVIAPAPLPPPAGGTDVVVVPPGTPSEPTPINSGCTPSQTPPIVPVQAPPVVQQPAGLPPAVITPLPAQPINNYPGQIPAQLPVDNSKCGQGGIYCGGGPGQAPLYPNQSINGQPYSHDDVSACFGAFQNAGFNIGGQWAIDVRSATSVNVLSGGIYDDHSTDHALIIVKSVSVLGQMHFNLLNPNALYCLKDVSVLEQSSVTSCLQSNVVSLLNVSVLSQHNIQVVNCAP